MESVNPVSDFRIRARVPGLSMWRLATVGIGLGGLAAVTCAIGIVNIILTGKTIVMGVLVFVMMAFFVAAFSVSHWVEKKKIMELAAGYTTSRFGYPNVEMVDAATGLIVRAAGEPLLDRSTYRARIRAYKAHLAREAHLARDAQPGRGAHADD